MKVKQKCSIVASRYVPKKNQVVLYIFEMNHCIMWNLKYSTYWSMIARNKCHHIYRFFSNILCRKWGLSISQLWYSKIYSTRLLQCEIFIFLHKLKVFGIILKFPCCNWNRGQICTDTRLECISLEQLKTTCTSF